MTYEEQRASLAQEYGWTYETIDSMTFEQISDALRGGKVEQKFPVHSHDDVIRMNRRMRRVLLGH